MTITPLYGLKKLMMNLIFYKRHSVALLLDPDKISNNIEKILENAVKCQTDYIMVGGSLTHKDTNELIDLIKSHCNIPVILFPGSLIQLSLKADYILYLSLISGRNPDLLIGNQVVAAPFLKKVKEKVISTGYILVNCGNTTSVEYMSQTRGIPSNKDDIAVATALAGEMLGLKTIYLEAGSGANHIIPSSMIKAVKDEISIPLIVGGGIRSAKDVETIFKAGADMVVVGNNCESDPDFISEVCAVRDKFSI